MRSEAALQPVDAVDVTIVVDNSIDISLPSTEVARRPSPVPSWYPRDTLIAEPGFSLLVTVRKDNRTGTVLFDAGLGRHTAIHNLDVLGVGVNDVRAVVLSNGHLDHYGGLVSIVRRVGRARLPLVVHPDAWRERKTVSTTGAVIHWPPPSREQLEREGVEVVEARTPSLLLDGTLLVTGQIDRATTFERGTLRQYARTAAGWEPDGWTWDDQALVLNLKGKGLVVLSSCSHAGIINVLHHARRLTDVHKVHAVIGGLHLTGGMAEVSARRTIEELLAMDPDIVVPCHCTGWQATHELARRLPEGYVQPSVGTRLHFA